MSSEFGKNLRVSVFGDSHGNGIGVVVNGFPAGESVDMDRLLYFIARRAPGSSKLTTQRTEADLTEFLSGIRGGDLTGSPFAAVIRNTNQRSGDYKGFEDTPRPSHADYTAAVKWNGAADMRGGGHFSGRLTAPLGTAGGIAIQILARRGIRIAAHLANIGGIADEPFPVFPVLLIGFVTVLIVFLIVIRERKKLSIGYLIRRIFKRK